MRKWLLVRLGPDPFHLNTDSKRVGVASYFRLLDVAALLPWHLSVGRAGKSTGVVFGDRMVRFPGFYLYRRA